MIKRLAIAVTAVVLAGPVYASHVPVELDRLELWQPLVGAGYLEFIEIVGGPIPLPLVVPGIPPGFIDTEEHTGFVDLPLATGTAVRDPATGVSVPPYVSCTGGHDCDMYAGDRADFDYVQEHHWDEVDGPDCQEIDPTKCPNHPGAIGMLGWTIGTTVASPHTTGAPGVGAHGHSLAEAVPGGFPELALPDFTGVQIGAVDIFSITSVGVEDGEFTPRDAALDYEMWFVNSENGQSTPGAPINVFVPGWTNDTTADNYIARWVPTTGGRWDSVAVDPIKGAPHDRVIEIDAVVAANSTLVPTLGTPGLASLIGLLAGCTLLVLGRRPALQASRSAS